MTFEKWVCRFCKILFFNRAPLNDDADSDADVDAINGTLIMMLTMMMVQKVIKTTTTTTTQAKKKSKNIGEDILFYRH